MDDHCRYKREVAEWEQVIKTKKSEAEQTVRYIPDACGVKELSVGIFVL